MLEASRSGASVRYRMGMVRRKPKRQPAGEGTKVAKALRDAILIADDALDKLKARPVKSKRPKHKH